jgi:HKD family nuclease
MGKTMPELQTLFGEGYAVVVGLPKHFDLFRALRSAKEIRLATAFAHRSGWISLKPGIEASSGNVFLLTGLEYNQTEPALLKDWMHLKLSRSDKVTVNLASGKPFFHPKVLIVRSPKTQFAVVGSGNMSKGGLHNNCECGVFVSNASTVDTLCGWFDAQFAAGSSLNEQMIKAYEPDYKKAKKREAALAREQKKTEEKLKNIGEASFAKWSRALELAETYFHNKDFNAKYTKRRKSVKRMLHYLNPPTFDFDRHDWFMFYQQTVLGALDSRSRDKVFNAKDRLRNALLGMANNPERAIQDVLGRKGRLRIKGFGINTFSKILAALYPADWPVYNERVATVLADFGYKAPRGAGRDGRYIAFRNAMQRFMTACKERGLTNVDAISLDAFFFDRSEELGF